MDDRRFDALARALASGRNRRHILGGLLGLGGVAVVRHSALETEAARRPTPTPKPVKCPQGQHWDGATCTCDSGVTCGSDCCGADSTCCDNACCYGACVGEEICCPGDQWCDATGECCPEGTVCCGNNGCVPPEEATCCCNDLQRCWDGLCFYKCEISGCQECEAWWNCISVIEDRNYCFAEIIDNDCTTSDACPDGWVCFHGSCIYPC